MCFFSLALRTAGAPPTLPIAERSSQGCRWRLLVPHVAERSTWLRRTHPGQAARAGPSGCDRAACPCLPRVPWSSTAACARRSAPP
eukprot:2783189-Rhodomonas_salina.1